MYGTIVSCVFVLGRFLFCHDTPQALKGLLALAGGVEKDFNMFLPLVKSYRARVGVFSSNLGQMSKVKVVSLPEVAGLTVHGFVRVTLGFLSEEDINGANIAQGGVSIGLRYDR